MVCLEIVTIRQLVIKSARFWIFPISLPGSSSIYLSLLINHNLLYISEIISLRAGGGRGKDAYEGTGVIDSDLEYDAVFCARGENYVG